MELELGGYGVALGQGESVYDPLSIGARVELRTHLHRHSPTAVRVVEGQMALRRGIIGQGSIHVLLARDLQSYTSKLRYWRES